MSGRLIIPTKKYRGNSSVVSARLPENLVSSLDEIAEKSGRTRNEIVQLCLEFAVENIDVE